MAKLIPYNIKVKVYCADGAEARQVQNAANDIAASTDIIGSEVTGFYAYFKRNEPIIVPVLRDVLKNGIGAIGKHVLTLRKIK